MAGDARETLGYVDESDLDLVLRLDARADGPFTAHLAGRAGLEVSGALKRGAMTIYVDLDVDASRLPADVRGKRWKKSYRLEVDCRPISMAASVDDQREALREAVQPVGRLREWATGVIAAA